MSTFIARSSQVIDLYASDVSTILTTNGSCVLGPGELHITEPIEVAEASCLVGAGCHPYAPIGTTIVNHGKGPAIVVPAERRGWSIAGLRIVGDAGVLATAQQRNPVWMPWDTAEKPGDPPKEWLQHVGILVNHHASHYRIEDVSISEHLDGLRVGEGNFQVRLIAVSTHANARHGKDIGSEAGGTGTTVKVDTCFSHGNGSWGDIYRNLWGLNLVGQAADGNRHGGTIFRHTAGTVSGSTSESNPIGMWFQGARCRMSVHSPTTDGCVVPYKADSGARVTLLNSELS